MGYYTDYEIEFEAPDELTEYKMFDVLGEISDYGTSLSDDLKRYGVTNAMWYDWKDHIIELSRRFPEVLITVHGEGEDGGDIWVAYAKGGKFYTEQAKIVFSAFDESMLR